MKFLSHASAKNKDQKSWRDFSFALLLVVFKWHLGSEGVNVGYFKLKPWSDNICWVIPRSDRFRHGVDLDAGELVWPKKIYTPAALYEACGNRQSVCRLLRWCRFCNHTNLDALRVLFMTCHTIVPHLTCPDGFDFILKTDDHNPAEIVTALVYTSTSLQPTLSTN